MCPLNTEACRMSGHPVVSIILPCYNVEGWIDRAIKSVIGQSLKNWELIIIDDGSTDKTYERCQSYVNCDSRIKIISQINQGQGAARNRGIEIARGNYILFLDGDDLLLDIDSLLMSVKFLNQHKNIDFVQFPHIRFTEAVSLESLAKNVEQDKSQCTILSTKKDFIEHTDILNSVSPTSIILKTAPWGKLFRTELFDTVRFPEGMVFEDTYMYCKLFSVVRNIAFANTGLYGNFERIGSTTCGKPSPAKMQDKIKAYSEVLTTLQQYSTNKALISKYIIWILNLISSFKSMFNGEFCVNREILYHYKGYLRYGGLLGCLIYIYGINNYISLRVFYYNLKKKLLSYK